MPKPILLSDYRKTDNKKLSETDRFFLSKGLSNYCGIYHVMLRQLGKEDYTEGFSENEFEERAFFDALNPEQKMDLEGIAIKLGNMIRDVKSRLRESD